MIYSSTCAPFASVNASKLTRRVASFNGQKIGGDILPGTLPGAIAMGTESMGRLTPQGTRPVRVYSIDALVAQGEPAPDVIKCDIVGQGHVRAIVGGRGGGFKSIARFLSITIWSDPNTKIATASP